MTSAPPLGHAAPPASMKVALTDGRRQSKTEIRLECSDILDSEHLSSDRDRHRSVESCDKIRSPASYATAYKKSMAAPVSDQKTAPVTETTTSADNSSQPMRYTDVCKDIISFGSFTLIIYCRHAAMNKRGHK
jgi:hypothetical protein